MRHLSGPAKRRSSLFAGVCMLLLLAVSSNSQHPLAISVEATSTTVSLAWDAVPGATTYHVTAREGGNTGDLVAQAAVEDTTHTIVDLDPNTEIVVTVSAEGHFKADVSSTKAIKTAVTDIGTPANLRTLSVGNSNVEISWSAVPFATSYIAKIRPLDQNGISDNLVFEEFEVDSNQRSALFQGLLPDHVYTVHVSAVDSNGIGRPAVLPIKTRPRSVDPIASYALADFDTSRILPESVSLVLPNHPPKVTQGSLDIQLSVEEPIVELDLQDYFADPERGPLIFTAYPLDPEVVATSGDHLLALNAVSEGTTNVHVTATDVHGESTSQYISITVDGDGFDFSNPSPNRSFGLVQNDRVHMSTRITRDSPLVIRGGSDSENDPQTIVAQNLNRPLVIGAYDRGVGIDSQFWHTRNVDFSSGATPVEISRYDAFELEQYNVSGRHSVSNVGGVALAVHSDYAAALLQTDPNGGYNAEQRLVSQLRAGLEGSFTTQVAGIGSLTPYTEINLRQDTGLRDQGTGVELAGGLRLVNDRLSLEAQGRAIAAHTVNSIRENSFSVRAAYNPSQDGTGLSVAVEPSWGTYHSLQKAQTNPNPRFLARRLTPYSPIPTVTDVFNVNTRIGYGLRIADDQFLLTPFLDADLSDVYQQTKLLGMRLDRLSDYSLPFSLDMAIGIMERDQTDAGIANMTLSISF